MNDFSSKKNSPHKKFLHQNPSSSKKNGHPYPSLQAQSHSEETQDSSEEEPPYALTEEIDHRILMHRDAHFGGDFNVMLSYYRNEENWGIEPEFDIERISYLAHAENEIGQDLAPLILTGAEAELVGKSRQAYAQLKGIYHLEGKTFFPQWIADLILSEEEEPLVEIEKVVSQGTAIVPDLIRLIQADDFYNPLFPGYGYAPSLAILCLGKIQDTRALIPLFDTLSKSVVFDEMIILESFVSIGEPAKEFLLKILKSRPLTQDNSNAAFALMSFAEDYEVALICFEQLKDPSVQDKPLLRAYLLNNASILCKTPHLQDFIHMTQDTQIPKELRLDVQKMIRDQE